MMKLTIGLFCAPVLHALKVEQGAEPAASPVVGEKWDFDTSGKSTVYTFDVYPKGDSKHQLPYSMRLTYSKMWDLHEIFTEEGIELPPMPGWRFVNGKNPDTISHRGPEFRKMLQQMFNSYKSHPKNVRLSKALPCPFEIKISSTGENLPVEVLQLAVLHTDTYREVKQSLARGLNKKFLYQKNMVAHPDLFRLTFGGVECKDNQDLNDVESGATMILSWQESVAHVDMVFPCGNRYQGGCRYNKQHGRGIMTCASGDKYEGEFLDGKQHGEGVETFANGNKYEGEFLHGKYHGHGKYTYACGDKYEGEFSDGKSHGQGKFTYPSGSKIEGVWQQGELQGDCVYTDAEGSRYSREYKRGKVLHSTRIN